MNAIEAARADNFVEAALAWSPVEFYEWVSVLPNIAAARRVEMTLAWHYAYRRGNAHSVFVAPNGPGQCLLIALGPVVNIYGDSIPSPYIQVAYAPWDGLDCVQGHCPTDGGCTCEWDDDDELAEECDYCRCDCNFCRHGEAWCEAHQAAHSRNEMRQLNIADLRTTNFQEEA